MASSRALNNQQILRAALIVILGFVASGVLGFLRTAVLSAQFGTGEALDAFYAAQQIPELIFVLVAGGALGSSFIPIYARLREEDEAQAWRLASAVMTLAALAATALALLVIFFAPGIVAHFLYPGGSAETQALTTRLVQWMMVTPIIFSISGLLMGILQSHGLFLLPSIAISMNNIGIIAGALLIAPALAPDPGPAQVGVNNVYGLAFGAILSALLHLGVQLPGLRGIGARLRVLPDPRVPGVLTVLRLMGPRVLGLAVVQINFLVNINLASRMSDGSVVALRTAFNLMFFALGIIGQSVGSALFPTLAALRAQGDYEMFQRRLAQALRSVLLLALPATAAFIVYGEQIVRLFERGQWTESSSTATAWALAFYATGIAGFAALELLSRAFYALEDTRTPVLIGTGAMISNILLSLLLIRIIGDPNSFERGPFAGLALANALTTLVEAILLWFLLRRKLDTLGAPRALEGRATAQLLLRAGVASLLMAVFLLVLREFVSGYLARLLLGGLLGSVLFFGVSALLGVPEALAVPRLLLRRVRRSG